MKCIFSPFKIGSLSYATELSVSDLTVSSDISQVMILTPLYSNKDIIYLFHDISNNC